MKIEEVKKYFDLGFSVEEVKKIMEGGADEEPATNEPAKAGDSNPPDGEPEEGAKSAPAQESGSLSGTNKEIETWLSNMREDITKQIKDLKEMQQALNVKVFDTEDDGDNSPKSATDVFRKRYAEPEPEYDLKRGE